jgi:hypothetical protein
MTKHLEEELLKYDKGSLEYQRTQWKIAQAEHAESEIINLVRKLVSIWDYHPESENNILCVSLTPDNYINIISMNDKFERIFNYVEVGGQHDCNN